MIVILGSTNCIAANEEDLLINLILLFDDNSICLYEWRFLPSNIKSEKISLLKRRNFTKKNDGDRGRRNERLDFGHGKKALNNGKDDK